MAKRPQAGAAMDSFPAEGWKMEQGELIVTGAGGGDIVTTNSFSAFELQLEFKLAEGANSGEMEQVWHAPH